MTTRRLAFLVLLVALATGHGQYAGAQAGVPHGKQAEIGIQLSLMTFNIRYGTARDGENAWPNRAGFVADVIRDAAPDVVGLQEALRFQLDYLIEHLDAYGEIGVGRDDGRTRGEHASILYDRQRFVVDESGTFWLSDTPGEVASRTWGNTITRICTWARLVEKSTGRAFYVYNVHLDHRSQPSRERAVELVAQRIADRTHDDPVVFMGDFNAGEDNPAVLYLLGERERASEDGHAAPPSPRLVNAFRAAHPDAEEVGTFNGFEYGRTGGPMIDYIFVPPAAAVRDAEIIRTSRNRRYPSDHFPVRAIVELR